MLDKVSNSYQPRKPLTDKIIKHIQEAIGIVSFQPALSQVDMIREIVATIRQLGLTVYSESILAQQNQIMVCILSMLHQSLFILKDGKTAEAYRLNKSMMQQRLIVQRDGNTPQAEEE